MKLLFPLFHFPDVQRTVVEKRKVVLNFFPEGKDFRKRPMKLALELRQFEKPGFYLFRIDISLRQGRAAQFPFQLGNRLAKRDRRLKIRGHILIVSGQQLQRPFQMADLFKKSRFLATQNHLRPFVMPPQLLGPAPLRTHGFKLVSAELLAHILEAAASVLTGKAPAEFERCVVERVMSRRRAPRVVRVRRVVMQVGVDIAVSGVPKTDARP